MRSFMMAGFKQLKMEQQPLLLPNSKGSSVSSPLLRWSLKVIMWVLFVIYIASILAYPSSLGTTWYNYWVSATDGTLFEATASNFLLFSAPIILITFLAIPYLFLSDHPPPNEKPSSPSYRLGTFPVLVNGIFGVVTAAEFIGIVLFLVMIIWGLCVYAIQDFFFVCNAHLSHTDKIYLMLERTGEHFGRNGLVCLAFLFLPVSRGSVLLRLIGVPFEHATRYHVWLGNLTMVVFSIHGIFYIISWSMQGELIAKIVEWEDTAVADLAGVIALAAGILMWVTSLGPVRRQYFELFFYTHQLYIVFVVFFALHVGEFSLSIVAGGILLFIIDRFLRFCQSRKTVDIISATSLPCGTLELVLSKPPNLRYNALSFIFLQVREVSWLQWHPFSVSSSPLDGNHHISVLIKVLGGWTEKLRGIILNSSEEESAVPLKITASVEGPYGHASPYYLTYENLILVAGGSGISPFLAILSDILHRIKEKKPCSSRNILLIWAVKSSTELPLLASFDMESICPFFSDNLNIEIQMYVTRETEPPLEEGGTPVVSSSVFPVTKGCSMSVLVGTANNIWSGTYIIISVAGFIIISGLLDYFYITPFGVTYWWYKGFLLEAGMVAGVLIFGGMVIGFWHLWGQNSARLEENGHMVPQKNETAAFKDSNHLNFSPATTILYGRRPDFNEIFGAKCRVWGNVDVGVIVCGPSGLDSSVAAECRSWNMRRIRRSSHDPPTPIFHFNPHSFDL